MREGGEGRRGESERQREDRRRRRAAARFAKRYGHGARRVCLSGTAFGSSARSRRVGFGVPRARRSGGPTSRRKKHTRRRRRPSSDARRVSEPRRVSETRARFFFFCRATKSRLDPQHSRRFCFSSPSEPDLPEHVVPRVLEHRREPPRTRAHLRRRERGAQRGHRPGVPRLFTRKRD